MTRFLLFLFVFSLHVVQAASPFDHSKNLPIAYEGRFRSLDSAARLWLYDTYHKQQLKAEDLASFDTDNVSAIDLLWRIHFLGHAPWDHSPFFWIHYAQVKTFLELELTKERFSFKTLEEALRSKKTEAFQEIENVGSVAANSFKTLFQQLHLFESYRGSQNMAEQELAFFVADLEKQGIPASAIAQQLETHTPFFKRLRSAGATLWMLPLKSSPGEWVSLHAFHTQIYDPNQKQLRLPENFTAFSKEHFLSLREAYFILEQTILLHGTPERLNEAMENFVHHYSVAYATLAGKPYRQAHGKFLTYPTVARLSAETLYYRLPLIEISLGFYVLSLLLLLPSLSQSHSRFWRYSSFITLGIGFFIHTAVLILRCYILQRPPVSNMFETVVYVPWIAVAIGFLFYFITQTRLILFSSAAASVALLLLLKLTQVDARMENVQAVLDSQYWLIIHVLMVVGSYGAFVLCGILGHAYLFSAARKQSSPRTLESLAKSVLHTMYVGVALLIPGTILGGVWAAESWGRFWDWDPKESWAFISACVYLLFIHAYTFHRIGDFGLAVGSIAGLIAISFTWYGVNYVLGTGLHSYGFGNGGESYYFLYLGLEAIFLMYAWYIRQSERSLKDIT